MRIDASQVLGQGGIRIKAGAGEFAGALKEGETIRAEVLSNEKGLVSMRAEGGQVFKAKLDADAALIPGDKILLEVTGSGKDKGLVLISPGGAGDSVEETSGQAWTARELADKSLRPYLDKLAELKMPANDETARLMRDLVSQNPKLTLDQAAFLASNKIAGDADLMRAALAILSNGDKADVMIARLLALLNAEGSSPPANSGAVPPSNSLLPPPDPALLPPGAPQASPLLDLLARIAGGSAAAGGADGQGGNAAVPGSSTIITQSDGTMQSTNVEKIQEIITNDAKNFEMQILGSKDSPHPQAPIPSVPTFNSESTAPAVPINTLPAPAEAMPRPAAPAAPMAPPPAPADAMPQPTAPAVPMAPPAAPADAMPQPTAPGGPMAPPPAPAEAMPQPAAPTEAQPQPPAPAEPTTQPTAPPAPAAPLPTIGPQLTALLSEIPEFRGAPAPALERFSDMLLRVAGESAGAAGGGAEKLETLIDKLFTRIDRGDPDAGARLRESREELFARLALIEEAISRASPPARAQMLEQTHRLMEHVRLLNSIDQFVYMQLPVQLAEQRKAAELYLFKRKGGRKPDPENVNILLAIDLENMGRWESFINIRKKDVSIQMEVRGAAEKEHFNANTVMLHDLLAEAGFKLVSANITFSEEETTPLTALSSLGRHTTGRAGAIDFWI